MAITTNPLKTNQSVIRFWMWFHFSFPLKRNKLKKNRKLDRIKNENDNLCETPFWPFCKLMNEKTATHEIKRIITLDNSKWKVSRGIFFLNTFSYSFYSNLFFWFILHNSCSCIEIEKKIVKFKYRAKMLSCLHFTLNRSLLSCTSIH